ncbi:hypothetical protein PHYSODRAFT_472673 [Phytophthora sojae]|uniref:Uncharacterized protein n=1 Tax=Phytophthora sojae (strain P6497) TaxID=1094619 RepID=G4YQ27_PHYSP|nr:hypothetical protein PHYSODRAFT_472673 [Phytophthora sojae]EGZ29342.1 hypothetical protein PHYSODRAFT_472673 [Phytophthora sojae]|eukprot:XP_009516617.1 hypothetical protein PHYSODRAFT_472673 [Phytophthora sojae]
MQAPQKFTTNGAIQLYHAITAEKANEYRNRAHTDFNLERDSNLEWSPDAFAAAQPALYRKQAFLPEQEGRAFLVHYRTFLPLSQANDLRFVETVPDNPRWVTVDPCSVAGFMLIALPDGTCLHVFGWNAQIALKSDLQKIYLNKGDMILLRGDCIYAPVGKDSANICLHAYLDMPTYQHDLFHEPQLVPYFDNTCIKNDPHAR